MEKEGEKERKKVRNSREEEGRKRMRKKEGGGE